MTLCDAKAGTFILCFFFGGGDGDGQFSGTGNIFTPLGQTQDLVKRKHFARIFSPWLHLDHLLFLIAVFAVHRRKFSKADYTVLQEYAFQYFGRQRPGFLLQGVTENECSFKRIKFKTWGIRYITSEKINSNKRLSYRAK